MEDAVSTRSKAAGAALLLASLSGTTVARAQAPDVESEHQLGMQLRARGHDAEAAAVFRALFDRTGELRALARLGLAEGAMHLWVESEEHLQAALARQGDAWIAANRANLESALHAVEQHLGRVMVRCDARGATVAWAQRPAVPLPLAQPLRVAAGFVELVVAAPGHAPVTRRVAVPAGAEPVVVDVALAATDASPPPNAPAAVRAPTPAPTERPVDAPVRPWQRPLAIGLLAGAAGSLVLGVVGGVLRQGAAARFNDGGCRLYPDRDEVSVGGSACRDDLSATQTGEGLAIAGFVAGGALAIAGVAALVLAPSARAERPRVSAGVSPGGVHLGVAWRY
jgi:hypothetical protein